MWPTWGPSGADRTQVGPMLAPWTLLSGFVTLCLVMLTIYPIEHSHNFVVLCSLSFIFSILVEIHYCFTHIIQGYVFDTMAIVWLPKMGLKRDGWCNQGVFSIYIYIYMHIYIYIYAYQDNDSKDKAVSIPSYFSNVNVHKWKDGLDTHTFKFLGNWYM